MLHGERLQRLGGEGTPLVAEFADLELGPALGCTAESAHLLMRDALMAKFRLPGLWSLARRYRLEVWQLRELAATTADLSADDAAWIDAQLSPFAAGMAPTRLREHAQALTVQLQPDEAGLARDRDLSRRQVVIRQQGPATATIDGTIGAADGRFLEAQLNRLAHILCQGGDHDSREIRRAKALGILASPARALQLLQASLTDHLPDELDTDCPAAGQRGHTCGQITVNPERLLPKAEVIVHLTDYTLHQGTADPTAVARAEQLGPHLMGWLSELLGHQRISLRPVLAAGALSPSDSYEVPARMREAIALRNPTSVFPYSRRKTRSCDLDHTVAFDHGGGKAPPGQTRLDNLGPLHRKAHRAKTHGGWQVTQPVAGCFLWQSPLGRRYLVTPSGTIPLTHEFHSA